MNDSCKSCNKPMWVEGVIYDKINLCHPCYENNYTEKEKG